jgi:hypothetical protein
MKTERKKGNVIYSNLGSLVEALYASIPDNVQEARHRNILVAMAILDMQKRKNHSFKKHDHE